MEKRALLLLVVLLVGGAFIAKQQVAYRSEVEKIKARHREFIKASKSSEDSQAIKSPTPKARSTPPTLSMPWGKSSPRPNPVAAKCITSTTPMAL